MERIETMEFLVTEVGDEEAWTPRVMTNRAQALPQWTNPRTFRVYTLYDRGGHRWIWRRWGSQEPVNNGLVLVMSGFTDKPGWLTRMKIRGIIP